MRELRERAEPILRIIFLLLAALVVYELAGLVLRWNPFRGVTVPDLPALTSSTTNAPAGGSPGTNQLAVVAKGTNQPASWSGIRPATMTNAAATNGSPLPVIGSNAPALVASSRLKTNATTATNAIVAATNLVKAPGPKETKTDSTNPVAAIVTTNLLTGGTAILATNTNGTNGMATKHKSHKANDLAGSGFNPNMPGAKHAADLPPAVQSRITKIINSEILAPINHPLPMALLGIAGQCAFLRSAGGQTGLVKEGDTLDDIKLLRIGVNRVLIEQDSQKKELMIFSGYGGDSLLPKETTNENTHP
jgi:hypothetical protein